MLDVYNISEVGASGVGSFNQHDFKWDRHRSKRGSLNSLLHQVSTSMFARELCLPVIKALTQIFLDLSSALIVDAHLIQIIQAFTHTQQMFLLFMEEMQAHELVSSVRTPPNFRIRSFLVINFSPR
jgi:hypothetical protein